jgi:hypothetical protein
VWGLVYSRTPSLSGGKLDARVFSCNYLHEG